MLVQLAFIAGAMLLAGTKSYRQLENKNAENSTQDERMKVSTAIAGLAVRADEACQRFIQRKIDPLLIGKGRHEQMKSIAAGETTHADAMERRANRFIVLSAANMGIALLGVFVFAPLLIPATALGMYLLFPIYQRMFHDLFHERKIKMSLLMALYLSGFWLAGLYIFAGFACLLYFVGLKIVHQMEGQSQASLRTLFGEQPRTAWKVVDDVECEVPLEELQAGDIVVVNAGEPLPVDGLIVEGEGSIDQHMLTGESQPVLKEVGDAVLASTLLLSGRLRVRVEKAGRDTLSANIVEMLNNTSHYQSEIELKGQELANRTVLPNLALSLLALPLVGLRGAVAILGAGFGVNLRLVSMLTTMNYLTLASRHNVLIKDGRALDRLKDVDTVVFDKTGTLTLEQPHVAGIHIFESDSQLLDEEALLAYAATAEQRQSHPIAQAIMAEAEKRCVELMEIDDASYEVGYGIKVQIGKRSVFVGSHRLMQREMLPFDDAMSALHEACQSQGNSLVWVAVERKIVGALELHATLRPEAKRVVEALRARDIAPVIISGDQWQPTEHLAEMLGIREYFANVLPEDKALLVHKLQKEGHIVCFIGDGINDAIALKQADVSISIRGATTVATDTAQVVLMDRTLNQLDYLFHLAKEFEQTARKGQATTMIPGVICVAGAFFAGFGIYAAEILFQLGFFSGLAVAMRPLLRDQKNDEPALNLASNGENTVIEEKSSHSRQNP